MKTEEKPKPKPQSNRLRIGLLVVSVIVGVLLAIFSMMNDPR
jgi:hypothetical protein